MIRTAIVEPLFNDVLDITNNILQPGQSYSKMYGTEPRYNEFLVITNIIRKPKRKIYLDVTKYKCQQATEERGTDQQRYKTLKNPLIFASRHSALNGTKIDKSK